MISQVSITPSTPMGATMVPDGTTFRFWPPRASAVYLNGEFGGQTFNGQADDLLMAKDINGYWTGFIANGADGDKYLFWVVGAGSSGYKRDPYARGLDPEANFPNCQCIVRAANSYPWHDQDFVTPDFTNMIVYQIHVGTYAISTPAVASNFLDVIGKIPYLVALGINVLQPLPIDETETEPSMGYDGADLFSPDFPYFSRNPQGYIGVINALLAARNCRPITAAEIQSGHAQLQCLIDLLHLYGIAVVFDVVYNHAGGFTGVLPPEHVQPKPRRQRSGTHPFSRPDVTEKMPLDYSKLPLPRPRRTLWNPVTGCRSLRPTSPATRDGTLPSLAATTSSISPLRLASNTVSTLCLYLLF